MGMDSEWTTANSPEYVLEWRKRADKELAELRHRQALAYDAIQFLESTGVVSTPGFFWRAGDKPLVLAALEAADEKRWREDRRELTRARKGKN